MKIVYFFVYVFVIVTLECYSIPSEQMLNRRTHEIIIGNNNHLYASILRQDGPKSDQKITWAFNKEIKEIPSFLNTSSIEASQDVIQHMVYITARTKSKTRTCSGSILDSTHILTAAHCFYTEDGQLDIFDAYFVPATLTGEAFEGVVLVRKVHVLKSLNISTLQNDVAIVTVFGSLAADKIRTVNISNDFKLYGKKKNTPGQAFVSGYGIQEIERTGFLVQYPFGLKKFSRCKKRFTKSVKKSISKSQVICAVQDKFMNDAQTCFGDSGSSLFFKGEDGQMMQVGIGSFTEPQCGTKGSTSWFTNLTPYVGLIEEHKSGNFSNWNEILNIGI